MATPTTAITSLSTNTPLAKMVIPPLAAGVVAGTISGLALHKIKNANNETKSNKEIIIAAVTIAASMLLCKLTKFKNLFLTAQFITAASAYFLKEGRNQIEAREARIAAAQELESAVKALAAATKKACAQELARKAMTIQSGFRTHYARKALATKKRAAITIQSRFRREASAKARVSSSSIKPELKPATGKATGTTTWHPSLQRDHAMYAILIALTTVLASYELLFKTGEEEEITAPPFTTPPTAPPTAPPVATPPVVTPNATNSSGILYIVGALVLKSLVKSAAG